MIQGRRRRKGEQCVLGWGAGGTLESTMAGEAKPPIGNRALTERLFGLYVGPDPLQDDFKPDMVARARDVLKTS